MSPLFTIGHSDHTPEHFVSLLKRHEVNVVVDVRSSPYSRLHAQFNREGLQAFLKRNDVAYLFLGRELGARREEREGYADGQARYDLVRKLPLFQEGIERLRKGVSLRRLSLMCAEKDPITCHRMVLVCRELRSPEIEIQHILADGSLESTSAAESRLLDEAGLPQADLFSDRGELVETAYDKQAAQIAYKESAEEN